MTDIETRLARIEEGQALILKELRGRRSRSRKRAGTVARRVVAAVESEPSVVELSPLERARVRRRVNDYRLKRARA